MAMPKTLRGLSKGERDQLYKTILADLRPLISKHGRTRLKWALNRWTTIEGRRTALIRDRDRIGRELKNLPK